MHILLICDDLWHPGETVRFGLNFLTGQGHTLQTVMDPKDIVTPEMLRQFDAVIIAKGDCLNAANSQAPWFEEAVTWVSPQGYEKYVREGGAILFMHAGITFRKDRCPAMVELQGVQFKGHPPQCPVHFHVANPAHPIMAGVEDFTLPQDEHYTLDVLAEDLEVFAETSSDAGAYPAGLCRELGQGRVCILTPGHNAFAIHYPAYQRVILNALNWVAGR